MNTTDIKKAKKIRNCLVTTGTCLYVIGGLALFYPLSDPLMIRCASAAACFLAATLWVLPTFPKVSFSRCLTD